MGDSLHVSHSSKNLEPSIITSKRPFKRCLVASTSKDLSQKTFKCITSMNQVILRKGAAGDVGLFIIKIAALDVIRRFSRAKCPFIWRGLQALQLFGYPPFKWIQRWSPFKGLVKCVQTLSTPVLVLSIATTFSDRSGCIKESLNNFDDSVEWREQQSEPTASQSTPDPRISDDVPQSSASEKWLLQLHIELEKQGVTLPERINEDELRRFYTAANGDFSSLLSSIIKTIHWRHTCTILSPQELEVWSHLVFWHGRDVKLRPCLIIRLGLACSNLTSNDKRRFAQSVVSQIEHGVLQLVHAENPQITVLMDCKGLSPFRFPVQMMRSVAVLLQDHYPNRLGCLFVIQVPPVARMIMQTLTQVMKPVTRQKLRIEGENYHKVLSEFLQTVPSFLGGKCSCPNCSNVANIQGISKEMDQMQPNADVTIKENISSPSSSFHADYSMRGSCDHQVLRFAIVGVVMVWIFIAFIVGMHYAENHTLLYPWGGW